MSKSSNIKTHHLVVQPLVWKSCIVQADVRLSILKKYRNRFEIQTNFVKTTGNGLGLTVTWDPKKFHSAWTTCKDFASIRGTDVFGYFVTRSAVDIESPLQGIEMSMTFTYGRYYANEPCEHFTPLFDKDYKLRGFEYTFMDLGVRLMDHINTHKIN